MTLTETRYNPAPLSASTTSNWVGKRGGLPGMVRAIARALMRSGHTESEAIQLAIGAVKRWAAGGGKVHPSTRARAAEAVAHWEAIKATAGGRDMGPMLESSSAGDLLPVAPIPQPPKPREATTLMGPHRFAGNNLTACARCGRPINAKVHANRRKTRRRTLARIDELTGTRHRGLDGHVPVHGGHANTPAKARTVQIKAHHAHLDALEAGVTTSMQALFGEQKTSALARLHGNRGIQMTRKARRLLEQRLAVRESPPPAASGGAASTSGATTATEAAVAAEPAAVVDPVALFDPAYWTPRTAQSFAPTNAAAAEIGAQRVHTGLGTRGHDIDDTGARSAMNGALDAHAKSTANQVTDTTFKALAGSLNEGISNGESTPQLAGRVSDIFDNASSVRAEMIARTYTNSAVNGASLTYAQHLPPAVAAKKEWSSLHDPRVRPHHLAADGQKQALNVPFNVGGYALQHPGDPTAPLSEIANCRCTLLYE